MVSLDHAQPLHYCGPQRLRRHQWFPLRGALLRITNMVSHRTMLGYVLVSTSAVPILKPDDKEHHHNHQHHNLIPGSHKKGAQKHSQIHP